MFIDSLEGEVINIENISEAELAYLARSYDKIIFGDPKTYTREIIPEGLSVYVDARIDIYIEQQWRREITS